jgi:predicted alpha/beta-hydrolase family hydrolase
MKPDEIVEILSAGIGAFGKPEQPSVERMAELWSTLMTAARKDILGVSRDELWYLIATVKEVERLKAERDELVKAADMCLGYIYGAHNDKGGAKLMVEKAIAKVQK